MKRSEFWARIDLSPLKMRKPSAPTEDLLKSESAQTETNSIIKPAKELMNRETYHDTTT